MDKYLRGALLALGCDDKEISLFIASYLAGSANINELAKSAKLQRSTAYNTAATLLEKGLLSEDHKVYGKTLTAAEPEALVRMVAAKQRHVGRQQLSLEEHMSELQVVYQANEIRPRVKTYQGVNGLVSVWRDILTAQSEILIWTNQATESKLFNTVQHDQFIAERRRGGKRARVLTVDNMAGRKLPQQDSENLRETRLLPLSISFSAETYIYDHKVAMLDYNQDIIGIITESQQIAAAHAAMFETAWRSTS